VRASAAAYNDRSQMERLAEALAAALEPVA
jgi:selenocysteine lyase/cysteine desulfurase